MTTKFRHELKYSINSMESQVLSSRLKHLFSYDHHADSHGTYRVSSLYFDTPYDKALKEKLDGICHREKFRLRYYGPTPDLIRLEKKSKYNGLCSKQGFTLSLQQTKAILAGDIDFLLRTNNPLCIEFYSKIKGQLLAPKTIVTYSREAFLYPPGNVRITIDRDITTYTNPLEFLNLPPYSVNMSGREAVLEIKYDAFLPDIVSLAVQDIHSVRTAYSKYAVARRFE